MLTLSNEYYFQLFDIVQKKLKNSGISILALETIRLNAADKLTIQFITSREISLTAKVKKNLLKDIAEFLANNNICKKYSHNEIEAEFYLYPPSTTQVLFKSLSNLTPQPTTNSSTISTLGEILLVKKAVEPRLLATILSDYIWPELSNEPKKLYRSEMHDLNPLQSIMENACYEAEFIAVAYNKLATDIKAFFSKEISTYYKPTPLTFAIQQKNEYKFIILSLVKLNHLEYKFETYWNKYEYLYERLEILNRVCKAINQFYQELTPDDIDKSLWNAYQHFIGFIPKAESVINKLIYGINYAVQETDTMMAVSMDFLMGRQSALLEAIAEDRIIKDNLRSETVEKLNKDTLSIANSQPVSFFSPAINQPDPEKKATKTLATSLIENEERKRRLKEEKQSGSEKIQELLINEEALAIYQLHAQDELLLTFTINDPNVFLINSKLKFYCLAKGGIELTSEYKQVLENKEDRNFLSFTSRGKSGLKLLKENIIVIKPKTTGDRMLLISITLDECKFFLPANIISHQQWMRYASGQGEEELEELSRKISSIFSLRHHEGQKNAPSGP